MNDRFVSIVVAAYNAKGTIKKCLDSLLGLAYPHYEIIVVDDGSTDETKAILSQYKERIVIIENQHAGPSKCRNIAAQRALGEFLAFTDADCIVDRNWLKELLQGFSDERVVSVGGSQHSPQDGTEFGKNVQKFFELTGFLGGYIKAKDKNQIIEVAHNPSCNAMYRKGAFLEIGGFDEGLWPCEDVDLDYRLKKKKFHFRYNSHAVVYHYRPQSMKSLSRMMYRYGVMQGILTKRYGFFRRIQFIPIAFVLFLALAFRNPSWVILLLMPYLFSIIKTKSFLQGNVIAALCIASVFVWMNGFFKGLAAGK